jgi:phosphoribosylformimino-5-aminoimidazole carboxamide ribotide isomerase
VRRSKRAKTIVALFYVVTSRNSNDLMKFRPCIDLHQGQVKQIVGSTLKDHHDSGVATNFATTKPSTDFAAMYRRDRLMGGHVIMLGPGNDDAALAAIQAFPGGLQVGGGITDLNCQPWISAGASHVIVTSFVFTDGKIRMDRLTSLRDILTKEKLVLDLSCRRKPGECSDGNYYVVTDRWQTFTDYPVNATTLSELAEYCDEFLVHGVDVEGKQCGILEDLVELLGKHSPIPVTYAGGVRSLDDLKLVEQLGSSRVDCTVGSSLDIFGGTLQYDDVVRWHNERNPSSSGIN